MKGFIIIIYQKKTNHINGTHTHGYSTFYIDSCTDILYNCTQLVQMNCTLLYNLTLHIHRLESVVLVYTYTVVQSLYTRTVEPGPSLD